MATNNKKKSQMKNLEIYFPRLVEFADVIIYLGECEYDMSRLFGISGE